MTGDDIAQLVTGPTQYNVTDRLANVSLTARGPRGALVYFGELRSHFPSTPLGATPGDDLFHTDGAKAFCSRARNTNEIYKKAMFTEALRAGTVSGGTTSDSTVKTIFIGRIADAIKTGSATSPELFVSGGGFFDGAFDHHMMSSEQTLAGQSGTYIPRLLVMVNGQGNDATAWSAADDRPGYSITQASDAEVWIGQKIAMDTGWNLSDMYYVNNWPGTPLTQHKPDRNDTTNKYVTQVNYVSGYVCHASLR
ncbi:hypothetical protein KK760_004554 [Salmonella enterica]|nr:hypothetical protein [Salmonella enterica]